MTLGNPGMIEIAEWVADHLHSLHHSNGASIRWRRERHNLAETKGLIAKRESTPCGFSRESATPVLRPKPPSNFHAGCESCFKTRHSQSNKSGERGQSRNFHRPQAKTMAGEVRFDAVSARVTLRAGQGRRKILHHARIGIHGRKGLAILGMPGAEEQTLCSEAGHGP